MSAHERYITSLVEKFDKLPSRDQRVIEKIIDKMIDWNLTFPRAMANATLQWNQRGMTRAAGGDAEFKEFEESVDWWIEMGEKYG